MIICIGSFGITHYHAYMYVNITHYSMYISSVIYAFYNALYLQNYICHDEHVDNIYIL